MKMMIKIVILANVVLANIGFANMQQGNKHPTLPQVPNDDCHANCVAMTVPPSALDKITIINDFNAKQSQNLEIASDDKEKHLLFSNYWKEQIVLISKENGKYEYKFRFSKFHRQHKQHYVAKNTPYVLVIESGGNSRKVLLETFGVTDDNGYTKSVFLDFELKDSHSSTYDDPIVTIREFINVVEGYGNIPKDTSDTGVFQIPTLYEPYSSINAPIVLQFICPNRPQQFYFAMTDYVGVTPSLNMGNCSAIYYMVFDKKYGQDEDKHRYKK
ncbi:hypothetical protein [Moraxella oblonga]|uniref:hypothetical protein n=1 Tax=Moraxella oblonga TaxID=200413 RepID=UPI00082DEB4F|nr:hypothetical protein [Moraxella oblonga]